MSLYLPSNLLTFPVLTPFRIVLGSLNGQLESGFNKLATLHAKNNFSLAILTGDVFTPSTDDDTISSLLNGSLQVPLPTYFTIGTHSLPPRVAEKVEADEEICHNLHFLGKRSTIKTADGLRIVALGGLLDAAIVGGQSHEQHLPFHTDGDAKTLRGANTADILLTAMWPAGVWKGSKVALDPAQQAAVQSTSAIADLCAALKPRYHLSASPDAFFYEREPFVHPSAEATDAPSITRFISMAPFGNDVKAKAMYAFSLNKTDAAVPPGVTASPFDPQEKKRSHGDGSYSRFGRDGDGGGRYGHKHKQHRRRNRSPPPGPDRCYFCLSNANVSTHMLCSIGEESYITTAKGPLPTSTTFADQGLEFPAHFIIIPLVHGPTIPSMGDTTDAKSEASRAYREMTRFREAIQAMVASKSNHKLGVVTWEISRDRNVHLIWQVMALPAELIQKGVAEAAFRVEAENQKYPTFQTKELALEDQAPFGDFLRVWLWADNGEDKIKGKSLVMPLSSDIRFDLQYGRRVVAKLLGLEKRFVWQECEQTVEEETRDANAFKEAFKAWDFTLEGEE